VGEKDTACAACGVALVHYCPLCWTEVQADDRACPNCGELFEE
jgi:predicted amidophosphoribosyltransferase